MDCGNRAGNTLTLGDGAEQRRPGCRHLSQHNLHAVRSMPLSRAHCFAVWLDSSMLPLPPNPNASLKAFVFQLHISVQSICTVVVGAFDRCRDRLLQPCRLSHLDRQLLRCARHGCRHPFPSLCDEWIAMPGVSPSLHLSTFIAYVLVCAFSCRHVNLILAFPDSHFLSKFHSLCTALS